MGNCCTSDPSSAGGKSSMPFESKYKLSSIVLGEGAYGSVVLAENVLTQKRVAVKMMKKDSIKEKDTEKIMREVEILKSLNHPNVVQVYDFYEQENYFLIVMEYVDGGELFEKLVKDDDQYSEKESREVVHTLASALSFCLQKGVIHRDIKPENILLTKSGDIKLADFNLSKKIDPAMTNFKLLQTMCGTPNYVAPEILDATAYDYKCDIWSLGVITFLLLSGGYLPFFINPDTQDKDQLLRKVRKGKWKFVPEKAWSSVSEEAKDLLRHMLEKDTGLRYNYEQILTHRWFKDLDNKQEDILISGKKMLDFYTQKKMLMFSTAQTAAKTLFDLAGPRDEITQMTESGKEEIRLVPTAEVEHQDSEDFFDEMN